MRSTAEIGKGSLRIKGNGAILQVTQKVEFIFISFLLKILNCFCFADFFAEKGIRLAGQFVHFLFQTFHILFRNFLVAQIHIIIKASLDGWSHPKFNTGKSLFNCFCQQMCG